jgi:hypothetical protein
VRVDELLNKLVSTVVIELFYFVYYIFLVRMAVVPSN